MTNDIIFEADVECSSCSGTGIYKGFAEKAGAGVICYHCKGSGRQHIKQEYKKFVGRNTRTDVTRVYKTSAGFGITSDDVVTDEGKLIKFSIAGTAYADWLIDSRPKPIRDLHCPLQHYEQGSVEGEWLKNYGPCEKYISLGDSISACSKIRKKQCWAFVDSLPEKFKD